MQILSETQIVTDQAYVFDQWQSSLYPVPDSVIDWVSNHLLDGQTVVLFSGEHRFDFDATYIEPNLLSNIKKQYRHPNVIFADQNKPVTLNYALKKLNIKNLLLLNTAHFIRYRHWEEILVDIQHLKQYSDRIIVTMPILRFDFNRLKYSNQDIATKLGGVLLDDTVVICQ